MAVKSLTIPGVATWRTIEDAAHEIGLGRRTLNRWIAEGKLTAYTIAGDRRRYVDMEAIERLRKPKPVKRAK